MLEIMKQICYGVEYLHSIVPSIIHCDLKPENILLNCPDDWSIQVKVADFGLITVTDSCWVLGKYEGTCTYKAPELKQGISPSTASDIYSLGIMFFEMLYLFDTSMERSLQIQKLKSGKILTNTIIDRMISTDPSQRPNISDTIAELTTVQRQKTNDATVASY